MKRFFESLLPRIPLLSNALFSFAKWFLIGGAFTIVSYVVLSLTGIYKTLEKSLNLKASSPFVLAPLFTFTAIALACFLVGALMYFIKYKRPKIMTKFRKEFEAILNAEVKNAAK